MYRLVFGLAFFASMWLTCCLPSFAEHVCVTCSGLDCEDSLGSKLVPHIGCLGWHSAESLSQHSLLHAFVQCTARACMLQQRALMGSCAHCSSLPRQQDFAETNTVRFTGTVAVDYLGTVPLYALPRLYRFIH